MLQAQLFKNKQMKYNLNLLLLNLFIFTITSHAQVRSLTNSRPKMKTAQKLKKAATCSL